MRLRKILQFVWRRAEVERELDAEIQFHLDCQTQENIRRGMNPAEAHRAARLMLGGPEQVKEQSRDVRLGRFVETVFEDIRYGTRVLAKNPGYAAVAMLTLALGIGANTAIFSVVYGTLLRPLPYESGGQLVVLHQEARGAGIQNVPFSVAEIRDYRQQNSTLSDVVEHHSMSFLLVDGKDAERVETAVVSANFFDVLGVRPLLGRTFVASDEDHAAEPVLIMSYSYWVNRHGGDPKIVGRVFQMNRKPHRVVGVLPPIPQYPVESDVYMPTSQCPTRSSAQFQSDRTARMMTVFGRLKSGVKLEHSQADLATIAGRVAAEHPEAYPKGAGYGVRVAPLREDLTRRAQTTFYVLLAVSMFVLMIACANVANLMLARLLKIERELVVRAALGATRARLTRQLLTESLLLAAGGGLLGLLLAPAATAVLVQFASRLTPRASEVRLDAPVLIFSVLVSMATGLLFGSIPALSSTSSQAIPAAGSRVTSGRRQQNARRLLLVAQIGLSFMLLIGAGLMMRSFLKLQQVDAGFREERLLTMRLSPNPETFSSLSSALKGLTDILEGVRATNGVESAALGSNFPFSRGGLATGPGNVDFDIEGQPVAKGDLKPLVDQTGVSESYFETLGQKVIAGRTFTESDDMAQPLVAVINQTMARHRWPSADPLGKRIAFGSGNHWITIVGVVADVREYGLEKVVRDEVYLPLRQGNFANSLVVRTSLDPDAVLPMVRAAVLKAVPLTGIDQVVTVERLKDEWISPLRVTTLLMGLFAALALAISTTGIAATMALSVSQRMHELGIRIALGASRRRMIATLVSQGLTLALIGCVIGVAGSIALGRGLALLLFATSPTDAATFAAVAAVFLAVSAVACYLPARQVTEIDPLAALRQE